MSSTVLVVEDDPGIRELLRFTLDAAGFDVVAVPSAEQALDTIRRRRPMIALVDWMLPGMSGLSLVGELRRERRTSDLPVIMVTARGGETNRIAGLDQGADDYIEKPFSPREVVARLRALLRRRAPHLVDTPYRRGPFRVEPQMHRIFLNERPLALRLVEYKLLRFLLARANEVFTRDRLLDQVWGEHVAIEERTVDVHVRRLRLALGAEGRDLLVTVRGGGYMLQCAEESETEGAAEVLARPSPEALAHQSR